MKMTHFGYRKGWSRDRGELFNETFEGVFKAQNGSFHQSPIAFQQSSSALLSIQLRVMEGKMKLGFIRKI